MSAVTTITIQRPVPGGNETFVGVDAALGRSGVCVLTQGEISLTLIDTKKLRGAKRLAYIAQAFSDVISAAPGPIAMSAVEGGSYNSGGRLYQLGQAQGMAQIALYRAGAPVCEVPPALLKKFYTGHTCAPKELVVKVASGHLGTTKDLDDNLADAYALALVAESKYREAPVSSHEAEVLFKLKVEF